MIDFDINKLSIKHVYIKVVTQALGGSITIADPDTNETTRIPVPYHVARRFIKEHKVQHYVVPVLSAVMYYDTTIVAVERHHLGNIGVESREDVFGEIQVWESRMEHFVSNMTDALTTGNWFVDGTSVYQFIQGEQDTPLTKDGQFSTTPVYAYDFADFQLVESVRSHDAKRKIKQCLKFVAGDTEVYSPPIWKTVESIGKHSVLKAEDNEKDNSNDGMVIDKKYPYDHINDILLVNVNFALNAAKELSTEFGYTAIEPLCLDDLMVKMMTVNLPSLDSSIKKTSEIGMSYTHAMAWLMKFVYKSETLEQIMNVRALFKYLASTGCYQKRKLTSQAIFKDGKNLEDVFEVKSTYEMAQ